MMSDVTSVSTPITTTNQNHVYTYIHTYMEKRKKEEKTRTTNIVFYDPEYLKKLQEIATTHNTNISSIISNLIREFVILADGKSPQKTLFNFEDTPKTDFFDENWNERIRFASEEERERIKDQIIAIDRILWRYMQ